MADRGARGMRTDGARRWLAGGDYDRHAVLDARPRERRLLGHCKDTSLNPAATAVWCFFAQYTVICGLARSFSVENLKPLGNHEVHSGKQATFSDGALI